MIPSPHDRLLLAFANLASYGIQVRHAPATCAHGARAELERETSTRFPHGTGSCLLWTVPTPARQPRAGTGGSTCARLYCSDHDVVSAARAALDQMGLVARDAGDPLVLGVSDPGGSARARPRHGAP
ncbi:MAG: hypothetical protein Q8O56_05095 [Solirubrobacteraceae bacterium]|nr:hypothetical protein [Solirubrobacteraceae bacterium]